MTMPPVHVQVAMIVALAGMTLFVDEALLRASWAGAGVMMGVSAGGIVPLVALGAVLSRPDCIEGGRRSEWDVLCAGWAWGCAAMSAAGGWMGGAEVFQWMWTGIGAIAVASAGHGLGWLRAEARNAEADEIEEEHAARAPARPRTGASRRLAVRMRYERWTKNATVPHAAFEAWARNIRWEVRRGRSAARWDMLGARATRGIEDLIRDRTRDLIGEAFAEEAGGVEVSEAQARDAVRCEGAFARRCEEAVLRRWRARDARRRHIEVAASTIALAGACAGLWLAAGHASTATAAAVGAGAAATALSAFARVRGWSAARRTRRKMWEEEPSR